jgi:sugar phosphate isomerase/epimerase
MSSGKRCLQLQEAFGSPIDIIWDTHHTWKLGNESALETWEQIGSMIQHIHIKDSISVPSARHSYSYVLPGAGEFPVGDVFAILNEHNFDGVVSLEWERKWHPYLSDLNTALETLKTAGWWSPSVSPAGA